MVCPYAAIQWDWREVSSRLLLELELDCLPDIVTENILVHKILLPRISSETNTLVAEEVLSNKILWTSMFSVTNQFNLLPRKYSATSKLLPSKFWVTTFCYWAFPRQQKILASNQARFPKRGWLPCWISFKLLLPRTYLDIKCCYLELSRQQASCCRVLSQQQVEFICCCKSTQQQLACCRESTRQQLACCWESSR